jgi:hypothetical protein
MIGDMSVQPKPAKPSIGQIEVDFLAKAPLRSNAKAIAHDQHSDHQLRIDRGPADRAVEPRQLSPQVVSEPASAVIVAGATNVRTRLQSRRKDHAGRTTADKGVGFFWGLHLWSCASAVGSTRLPLFTPEFHSTGNAIDIRFSFGLFVIFSSTRFVP